MSTNLWIAIAVFWAGAYLDYLTTKKGLKTGQLKEQNRLARFMLGHTTIDVVCIVLKGGVFAALFYTGAPAFVYYGLGGMQLLLAARNHKLRRDL